MHLPRPVGRGGLALEVLQADSAAGGEVTELVVGEAEPTDRDRCVAAATARVPAAKLGISATPIGPFQKIVPALASLPGEQPRRLRPDIRHHLARLDAGLADHRAWRVTRTLRGDRHVGWQHQADAACGRSRQVTAGCFLVAFEQRRAGGVSLGGQERHGNGPADEDLVGRCRASS